jgi:hypothetical protein
VPGTIFLGKNDIANALGKIISPPLSFTWRHHIPCIPHRGWDTILGNLIINRLHLCIDVDCSTFTASPYELKLVKDSWRQKLLLLFKYTHIVYSILFINSSSSSSSSSS